MKVVKDFPPNYEQVTAFFPVKDMKGVVFTYGDTVYAPYKNSIPEHLKVHESVHVKQQGDNPAGWWDRYFTEPRFRLEQEIEAYTKQYHWYAGRNHNIKEQNWFLNALATDLSGPMYGNLITLQEARDLIYHKKTL